MLQLLRSCAFLALAASASTARTLTTVDPSGGSSALVDAVTAAQPGDTLIVLPGLYDAPSIDKPLQIFGSGDPATIQLDGKTIVDGLAAGETVVLRGLLLESFGTEEAATLDIAGGGTVWVEDCEVRGADYLTSSSLSNVAVRVEGDVVVPIVTFMRCTLRGGEALGLFGPTNNAGLLVTAASAFVYDCTIEAAQSGSGPGPALYMGGGAEVFVSGGSILGADGRPETVLGTCETDGGPAANVISGVLTVLDAVVMGGAAGIGNCGGAVPGPDFQIVFGTLNELTGDARSYRANAPVAVGETLSLELEGLPGDLVLLGVSGSTTPILFLPGNGAALGGSPSLLKTIGFVPASGSLDFDVPLGPLGVDVLTVYTQAVFVDAGLDLFLAPGSALTLFSTAP